MMKFVPYLGQYLNPIWQPGGHVEFLVIATPPDQQQISDTKPSAMYLVGHEVVS